MITGADHDELTHIIERLRHLLGRANRSEQTVDAVKVLSTASKELTDFLQRFADSH